MPPHIRRTYSHISLEERRKIERWLVAKISIDVMAEKLGRHRSTVFRELRRNRFHDPEMPSVRGYFGVAADTLAKKQRRYDRRKLARFPGLREAIIERIRHGWSPEQIAGRLKVEWHGSAGRQFHWYACPETIYRFAHSKDGQAIQLWRHLPERRARRRPRYARRQRTRCFLPEFSILNRPDAVRQRQEFGHWECDLLQFRKRYGNANLTSLVERTSRFTVFLRNNDRQSRPIMDSLIRTLAPLPHAAARRSR
ncbi:MAG TPA: IS30 family transposase [Pedomonas sp.]|uniref:IS30 family transposase n=1 Tax=Pedomonas sp. TaxID=2976421 RepID=UPI002F3E6B75